jgi:hypothetical protein
VNRGGVVGVKGCWCESFIYGGGFLPIPGSQVAQRNVALDLDGFDGDNLMAITWTRIEKNLVCNSVARRSDLVRAEIESFLDRESGW